MVLWFKLGGPGWFQLALWFSFSLSGSDWIGALVQSWWVRLVANWHFGSVSVGQTGLGSRSVWVSQAGVMLLLKVVGSSWFGASNGLVQCCWVRVGLLCCC